MPILKSVFAGSFCALATLKRCCQKVRSLLLKKIRADGKYQKTTPQLFLKAFSSLLSTSFLSKILEDPYFKKIPSFLIMSLACIITATPSNCQPPTCLYRKVFTNASCEKDPFIHIGDIKLYNAIFFASLVA